MSNVSTDLRFIYKVKGTQEIHNLLSLPYINFQLVKYLNKALPSLLFSIFRKLNMQTKLTPPRTETFHSQR